MENADEPKPSQQALPEPVKKAPAKKKKSAVKDWKPLGHVRDSFAEQIRQDDKFR